VTDRTGAAILEAATLWLVMDLTSRRPVRLPVWISEAMSRYDIGDRPFRPDRQAASDRFDREAVFTVRRSDLDRAGHVNNTSYIEWAVEAVPDELWSVSDLARLDIDYVSECHRGQTVASLSHVVDRSDEVEVQHRLVRRDDGETVTRARSWWRRCSG
jgi:acyl-ACP thioesterase